MVRKQQEEAITKKVTPHAFFFPRRKNPAFWTPRRRTLVFRLWQKIQKFKRSKKYPNRDGFPSTSRHVGWDILGLGCGVGASSPHRWSLAIFFGLSPPLCPFENSTFRWHQSNSGRVSRAFSCPNSAFLLPTIYFHVNWTTWAFKKQARMK